MLESLNDKDTNQTNFDVGSISYVQKFEKPCQAFKLNSFKSFNVVFCSSFPKPNFNSQIFLLQLIKHSSA